MKVAIVCDLLVKFGGAQQVLLAVSEMYPDAAIYCLLYDEKGTKGKFKDKKIIQSSLQKYPRFIRRRPKLLLSKYPRAIEEFEFSQYDIVISLSDSYAHGILTRPSTFHLCYCHTPMRYVWDWYHQYLRENNIGFGIKGLIVRLILHKIRIWDRISAHRVDHFVANSENVRQRIIKYYLSESSVIHPPIEINKISPGTESKDFYLIVSRLEPYKKVALAVLAFNKLGKPLYVIGEGTELSDLKKKSAKNIKFLGWQKEESLYKYLRECKALIFPGEEDFGLTPVEAMAAGKPVIAFGKGGVVESVIDGKTGLFFNESSADSLIQAVNKFETLTFSAEACQKQARNFSKEIFVQKFKAEIEESYKKYKNKMNT